MENNDRYIIELARAAVFDTEPQKPDYDIDWEYIYTKCNEQNIAGLVYCAVKKINTNENLPDKELSEKWEKTMLMTLSISLKRHNEFLHMAKIIQKENIKLVGLKGCIVRDMYPIPELRTMGDFDILTEKKNMADIAAIFKGNGYTVIKDTYGIVCKSEKAYWEIFFGLDEEFSTDTEKWTEIIYNNSNVKNSIIYCPQNTYLLAHIIIHTSRHFIQNGAGLRNLCDIALFLQKYKDEIDFRLIKKICEEQNYKNTYEYIINAVNEYFGVDTSNIEVEKRDSEKFMEYMMLNGVFGKHGNTLLWQVAKDEDENKGAIAKLFFPNVNNLKNRYKYLQKYPFMLPIAWLHRFFSALFKWKYSLKQMVGDMDEAIEFSRERIKWLNELELNDKH